MFSLFYSYYFLYIKNLVFWMHKCLMEFWLFSQKNVWFTPRLDIRAKPKGNEVTTTKWMVGGGEKMVINFLCNKVICVCPSTLQAFHFGKNSSSVTKEKKQARTKPGFLGVWTFPKAWFIGNAKVRDAYFRVVNHTGARFVLVLCLHSILVD